MLEIKHILFPVDFSERCCNAGPFVQAVAEHYGAKVTLFHALQPLWFTAMSDVPVAVDLDAIKEDLEYRLNGAFTKEFAQVPVERTVQIGDPAGLIVQYAHQKNVDLIMMPSHGYGPFRSLLLGSVTAKVLHDARCPVWTGAHVEGPQSREHLACRNILCAVDETPKSAAIMEWAAKYAADNGAKLRLMHVVPGAEAWPERQFDQEFTEELKRRAQLAIGDVEKSAGIDAPLCVAVGDVAQGVRDEAVRHAADLLVIGRGSLHETMGRLRTRAYSIIRQAPCPVVSI